MSGASPPGRPGTVYLVGAGPGDPRLLTVRAAELIRAAAILAVDDLVPPAIVELAPRTAEIIRVGRRRGAPIHRHVVHAEVIERARAGHDVVRLKGGDPSVFGRVGEEMEALAQAGIPFEVIPGVTAAAAAAAAACVPLTDRRHASAVTFVTGHTMPTPAAGAPGTLVLYMTSARLAANLEALLTLGWPGSTPAAYVASATLPRQRVVSGTLTDLAARVAAADAAPADPAVLLVGEVVLVREHVRQLMTIVKRRSGWPAGNRPVSAT